MLDSSTSSFNPGFPSPSSLLKSSWLKSWLLKKLGCNIRCWSFFLKWPGLKYPATQLKIYLIKRYKTLKYIGCVVGFSMIWNIPACFLFKYERDDNGTLFVNDTSLTHNPNFQKVYITWLHAIFRFLIPLTLLITFNTFSIKQVNTFK